MAAKKALGRGLDALIKTGGRGTGRVFDVEVHRLRPNAAQPRERFDKKGIGELAQSILEQGILQPLLVRPVDDGYEIIAGERRWRAAQKAGLHRVPVLVREAADAEMLEVALVENLQRENLNPVDEARAYKVMVEEFGRTQEEVAKRVGKERATVANVLRVLNLPEAALASLQSGAITIGHAKALLAQKEVVDRGALLEAILKKGLSVREAENFKKGKKDKAILVKHEDPDTAEAAKQLSRLLGLSVTIHRRGRGGDVSFRFRNETELQHLYEWIQRGKRRKN